MKLHKQNRILLFIRFEYNYSNKKEEKMRDWKKGRNKEIGSFEQFLNVLQISPSRIE